MARNTDLKALVERFAADIESAVVSRVNAEFGSRFDELRARILEGAASAPAPRGLRRKPGPRAGFKAELKPCPVCGTANKARRFSYLCEDHRSGENLKKFKGAAKTVAGKTKKRGAGRRASAKAAPRRGPGRPKKGGRKGAAPAVETKA